MKQARLFLGLAIGALAVAAAASAEPVPFTIDPAHSQVEFNIRHFFTKVPGRFNDFTGTISYDPKNLPASSVDVTIQAKSIYTNNENRDKHLRSPDFFFADSFATIAFKSTKVTPASGNKFKVEGNLTMRGVTKPVVLDAEFLGMGPTGVGGRPAMTRAGFDGTTTIDRKDFNILWNKTLDQGGTMLGDDVTIHLSVEALKSSDLQQMQMSKPAAPPEKPASTDKTKTDKTKS